MSEHKTTDFLVIGSGIAGLCFAIHASNFGKVIIITKKKDHESNTNYAQGGISCVLSPHDSFETHIEDTENTGYGLSNKEAVKLTVEEGPERIKELLEWGVSFTQSKESEAFGNLDLGKEGGHTAHRIVHAKDLTGREVETVLLNKIKANPNISIYENHALIELITNHHLYQSTPEKNKCYGAYVFNTIDETIHPIVSKITCVATGGAGKVYLHTTNPSIATGDGIACAYRAGAAVKNMEFIQFHPTTLFHPEAKSFLISEALRGYGAILRESFSKKEFMQKYHPMGALAPRDVVARAIDTEMKLSGNDYVYLDITHKDPSETKDKFPHIYSNCLKYGIDITKDYIPVVPASHYICGGISVNINGESTVQNLYACGEASCTGVHGANRLASNSLLEALVFSKQSAFHCKDILPTIKKIDPQSIKPWDDTGTSRTEEWVLISHNKLETRRIMWDYVGIVRSDLRLERAIRRIELLENETEDFYRRTKITPELLELRNIITVAKLIILSAQQRKESRGLHFTTDYPHKDDINWKKDTHLKQNNKEP